MTGFQALAYCMRVMYEDEGLKVDVFFEVWEDLNDKFQENQLKNLDVLETFVGVLEKHGFSRERYRKLASELHHAFDIYTKEAAEQWYKETILRK